jgi:hypothetical protein
LKAVGASALRDGVYLLPDSRAARDAFEARRQEIAAEGGGATIISFRCETPVQSSAFRKTFDRSGAFENLFNRVSTAGKDWEARTTVQVQRQLQVFRREFQDLCAVDFFRNPARDDLDRALLDLERSLAARRADGEPRSVRRRIAALDRRQFQGRVWATRRHLWVDRVCSAWLIRRFIDRKARFRWLKQPADLPPRALGFDFDGAQFTHIGVKVTFEVLLESFGLEEDEALQRLAQQVHYLDVGGAPVPESASLAAIVAGAQQISRSDDAMLESIAPVLDQLYAGYRLELSRP